MDTQKIDLLLHDLKKITLIQTEVGGGIEQTEIEKAENEIGFSFSADFKLYLGLYGDIAVGSTQICGLHRSALEESRRGGENVIVQAQIFREYNDIDLGCRTILINHDNEWYEILDHSDTQVYSYDPFSGKFEVLYPSLEAALVDVLQGRLDSYR